jgi:hypothetical protein
MFLATPFFIALMRIKRFSLFQQSFKNQKAETPDIANSSAAALHEASHMPEPGN